MIDICLQDSFISKGEEGDSFVLGNKVKEMGLSFIRITGYQLIIVKMLKGNDPERCTPQVGGAGSDGK